MRGFDAEAPHRKVVEDVCGAKKRTGTAQKSCGRCVRCEKANRHRTEKRWKIHAVQKCVKVPYRKRHERNKLLQ